MTKYATELLIGGELTPGAGAPLAAVDPATGKTLLEVAQASITKPMSKLEFNKLASPVSFSLTYTNTYTRGIKNEPLMSHDLCM